VPIESHTTTQDITTRVGGWLFRHRTSIPLPAALAILTLRLGEAPPSAALIGTGIVITVLGELIRLWGVHHIGAISRTRSERLGPLVASGPFALLRNPLYVGNILLWVGFALTARLIWLAAAIFVLLAIEYHAIVRWEEALLESRLGQAYRDYAERVPRWIPRINRGDRKERRDERGEEDLFGKDLSAFSASSAVKQEAFSWRATLFSERGTFVAMAAGYFLLWIKARF
jgi:protein-S-isoprenylcysteine O-methyltransferase Ste14